MKLIDKSASKVEFEKFKKETLKTFGLLETKINNKTSYNEKYIKNKAEKIKGIYVDIENKKDVVEGVISKLNFRTKEFEQILKELNSKQQVLDTNINRVKQQQNLVLSKKDEIAESSSEVNEKIQTIESTLETAKNLPEDIENIKNLIETSKEISEEIKALKKHSMGKKSDIDELYDDIYGKDIENENEEGEVVEHIDGIKDKLKKTYNDLNDKFERLDDSLDETIEKANSEFNKFLENSQSSYEKVNAQLRTLLPGAMASGLSSAYAKKTDDEKKSQKELENNFKNSLLGLILVSLIPIIIDIYRLIWTETPLLEVIKDTPILIISMLPIYSPILWFAHSSSKKLNLSKRLIEEYTHKAVLGNTFEGLSTQIESLSVNDSIRDELRVKLLFNLLQVSSENPGKLITDYQASDHPLMEALENSVKLSSSIDKLNKIPGFSAIAKKLSTKQDNIINKAVQDVEDGLNKQDDINKKENE